jgi:hypothetical protein
VEAILAHLLKETKGVELERLLLVLLPSKYLAVWDDPDVPEHLLRALVACYRTALDVADEGLKRKVAKRFVATVKEGSDRALLSYGTAFFRASDLEGLPGGDINVVRDHLLSRCKTTPSAELLEALNGIGAYLDKSSVPNFVDPLIRLAVVSSELSGVARRALEKEFSNTPAEIDGLIVKRLTRWVKAFSDSGNSKRSAIAEEIKASYTLPF